ncbi:MAG: cupin domain-containing protein [Planctomycetaceae bacterium]|jgi:transcriptional regulator with XRE-family HTH domain|nr:cupin domain-containing protein [Planctomycetaceae bacterium]
MHPAVRHLGNKVREARSRLGLSQRQLAERAGLSPGMLCLIERGEANPSVQSLLGLAEALGLSLASFFDDQPEQATTGEDTPGSSSSWRRMVLPAEMRPVLELAGGITWSRLTPGPEAGVEFREVRYEPGACSSPKPIQHAGREWGLVLEGELMLELGPERLLLRPGDSVVFDSRIPHRTLNIGAAPMRAVWVNFQHGPGTGGPPSEPEPSKARRGR